MSTTLDEQIASEYERAIGSLPTTGDTVLEVKVRRLLFELGYISGQRAALNEMRSGLRTLSSPFSSNTTSN